MKHWWPCSDPPGSPPQGDGNIRYYEVSAEKPYLSYLTEFRSYNPQKGIGEWNSQAMYGQGARAGSWYGKTSDRKGIAKGY